MLEKIEGDPNSDYINASYIPVSDALSCCSVGRSFSVTLVVLNLFIKINTKEGCHMSGNAWGKNLQDQEKVAILF